VPDEALTVKTDANGEWRCDAVPRHSVYLLVEASHPDYAFNNEEEVSTDALLAGKANLKMNPVAGVRGSVVDSNGQPVVGANVALGPADAIWPGNPTLETTSDSTGHFEFHRVRLEKRLLGVKAETGAPTLQKVEVKKNLLAIEVKLT